MTIYVGPRVSSATGGSVSTISGFTVHTFSAGVGTFIPSTTGYVEVLTVGAGGYAPPSSNGGGGGGGSVLYQKFIPVLSGVAYTMTVGSLGLPLIPAGASTCTYNGGSITAPGGGSANTNNPLGSGGGGGTGSFGGLGANIIGYGFSGGNGPGGSGGGAGGIGLPGFSGTGGIGLSYSISGVSSYYGGGGGGAPSGASNPAPSLGNFGYGGRGNGPFGGGNGVIIIRYIT